MKTVVFNTAEYLKRQLVDALTCPINRHGTRVENKCDDWGLWRNPQLLVDHYIQNGGALAFAARRVEFFREIEKTEPPAPIKIEYQI